jgi:hypothetical protein
MRAIKIIGAITGAILLLNIMAIILDLLLSNLITGSITMIASAAALIWFVTYTIREL